jgi:putative hydrolase of the HAD superfamily
LEELGLARFFAVLSDSTLVGWSKPDPRIFAHTLAALQVSPQRAWMVGDNFEADIRGAAGLGIRTCWLAPSERTAPPGAELVPTARISRLPDVEEVLE